MGQHKTLTQLLLAAILMTSDFTYFPTEGHTIGCMSALLVLHGLINSLDTKALKHLNRGYILFCACQWLHYSASDAEG